MMTNIFRFSIAEDYDYNNQIIEVELGGSVELDDRNYPDMKTLEIDEEWIDRGDKTYEELPETIKQLILKNIENQIYVQI